MNKYSCIVLCALIVSELLPLVNAIGRPSTMLLENNGYKNMVIAIDESVQEDPNVISGIQDAMTKASKFLYNATRQRAFFKEITILVPNSWTPASTHAQHTSESKQLADVIIVNSTSRKRRALPQTRMYAGCGSQGVHVLLTQEFATQPRSAPYFNLPGKYFVHAFANFRWGVFQEYGEIGESQFYLSLTSGKPEGVRCVYYMRGLIQKNDASKTICYNEIDPVTGLYTPDCLWRPYPSHQRIHASYMDHQYIQEIETFCDDTSNYMYKHNAEAPSKHNRLCDHRSTWDIITNTPDFSNGANPTRPGLSDQELTPSFKVVRAAARRKRAVVIVDPSVKDTDIRNSDVAKAVSQMQHEFSKHSINISLQHHTENLTSLEHLAEDTHVVRLASCHSAINQANMTSTSHILMVPRHYNGSAINDGDTYISGTAASGSDVFVEHLRHVITSDLDIAEDIVTLHRRSLLLSAEVDNGSVALDSSLQKIVYFRFHYSAEVPTVELRSPSGNTYGIDSAICYVDHKLRMVEFTITVQFEVGTWQYFIRSIDNVQQAVSVTVMSLPDKQHDEHMQIKTSAKLHVKPYSHIALYVDVLCHMDPVVGLDVRATVVAPDGTIAEVQLLDNGAGADTSKDDGIYSRYYTNLTCNGVYHVTYVVIGNHGNFYIRENSMDILSPMNDENLSYETSSIKRKTGSDVHRHVTANSVLHFVDSDVVDDVIPPSRIQDLKILRYLRYKKSFVLQWTAPGDDLDTGKVSKYRLWIGRDVPDVRILKHIQKSGRKPFSGHVTMESMKGRHEGGKTQVLVWPVRYLAKTYAFGIQAEDDVGNVGEMSNIATGSFTFS